MLRVAALALYVTTVHVLIEAVDPNFTFRVNVIVRFGKNALRCNFHCNEIPLFVV